MIQAPLLLKWRRNTLIFFLLKNWTGFFLFFNNRAEMQEAFVFFKFSHGFTTLQIVLIVTGRSLNSRQNSACFFSIL